MNLTQFFGGLDFQPFGKNTAKAPCILIKSILFALFVFIPFWGNASTETTTYPISFSLEDFSFEDDENGCVHILAPELEAVYSESNVPGLPLLSYSVAIDGNAMYLSSNPRYTKRLVKSNVTIAQSPIPIPTNSSSLSIPLLPCSYPLAVYPSSNCQYAIASEWENVKILHFQICPFVYDAIEKNLYFIDRIDLDITIGDDNRISSRSSINTDSQVLRTLAKNVDEVDGILSKTIKAQVQDRKVDYVIVTSNALKSAFEPLLKWKKAKGVYAEIATIENIKGRFSGYDTQFAIKCYLYELYHRNSLKYVLLGGDDTVVPVRGCFGRATVREDSVLVVLTDTVIPTDMYYACYGGDFTWDGNGNGVYGETTDNLNLSQSVYVSRVPVRTQTDVEAFVNKLR